LFGVTEALYFEKTHTFLPSTFYYAEPMMRDEAEATYKALGLEVRHITDKPGFVYPAHRHGEVILCILSGSGKLRLDEGEWMDMKAGEEFRIADDQLHEVIVGPHGWEYLIAASPEEMKRLGR
jgi:quercetin dioxygenase-like cupin family protein